VAALADLRRGLGGQSGDESGARPRPISRFPREGRGLSGGLVRSLVLSDARTQERELEQGQDELHGVADLAAVRDRLFREGQGFIREPGGPGLDGGELEAGGQIGQKRLPVAAGQAAEELQSRGSSFGQMHPGVAPEVAVLPGLDAQVEDFLEGPEDCLRDGRPVRRGSAEEVVDQPLVRDAVDRLFSLGAGDDVPAQRSQDRVRVVAAVARADLRGRRGHGRPHVVGRKARAVGEGQGTDHLARGRGNRLPVHRKNDALQVELQRALHGRGERGPPVFRRRVHGVLSKLRGDQSREEEGRLGRGAAFAGQLPGDDGGIHRRGNSGEPLDHVIANVSPGRRGVLPKIDQSRGGAEQADQSRVAEGNVARRDENEGFPGQPGQQLDGHVAERAGLVQPVDHEDGGVARLAAAPGFAEDAEDSGPRVDLQLLGERLRCRFGGDSAGMDLHVHAAGARIERGRDRPRLQQPRPLTAEGEAHDPPDHGGLAASGGTGDDEESRLSAADPGHDLGQGALPSREEALVAGPAAGRREQVLDGLVGHAPLEERVVDEVEDPARGDDVRRVPRLAPVLQKRLRQVVPGDVPARPVPPEIGLAGPLRQEALELADEDAASRRLVGQARGDHAERCHPGRGAAVVHGGRGRHGVHDAASRVARVDQHENLPGAGAGGPLAELAGRRELDVSTRRPPHQAKGVVVAFFRVSDPRDDERPARHSRLRQFLFDRVEHRPSLEVREDRRIEVVASLEQVGESSRIGDGARERRKLRVSPIGDGDEPRLARIRHAAGYAPTEGSMTRNGLLMGGGPPGRPL
jgi:hypothetical protein